MKMTLKEAVLKSLEEINVVTNYLAVYNNIVEHKYYDFGSAKTPTSTVSAVLGSFVRHGDTRVKRIKQDGATYSYYLTKNEPNIDFEILSGDKKLLPDSKLNVFEEFCVMKQEGSMEDYYFVESTIESCCEAAFDRLTNDEKFILTHQYGFFGKDGSELIMDDFLYYIDNYKSKRIRDSLDRRC